MQSVDALHKGRGWRRTKSRWNKIKGYIERNADEDGWVARGFLLQRMSTISAVKLNLALEEHWNEVETREMPRRGEKAWGRPRQEIRIRKYPLPRGNDATS